MKFVLLTFVCTQMQRTCNVIHMYYHKKDVLQGGGGGPALCLGGEGDRVYHHEPTCCCVALTGTEDKHGVFRQNVVNFSYASISLNDQLLLITLLLLSLLFLLH